MIYGGEAISFLKLSRRLQNKLFLTYLVAIAYLLFLIKSKGLLPRRKQAFL
jgi:hypothetical protein